MGKGGIGISVKALLFGLTFSQLALGDVKSTRNVELSAAMWAKTGLTTELFVRTMLTSDVCYDSQSSFVSCYDSVNYVVTAAGDEGFVLLPTAYADSHSEDYLATVKVLGGFGIFKTDINALKQKLNKLTPREAVAYSTQRRNEIEAAVSLLFQSGIHLRVNFGVLYLALLKVLNVSPKYEAMLAGEAFNTAVLNVDSHAALRPAELVREMEQGTDDAIPGGIGAVMMKSEAGAEIKKLIPTGPGKRAGLKKGDVIVSVDDVNVTQMNLDQVVGKITGRPETTVKLGVLRQGTVVVISVVREIINPPNVTLNRVSDLGVKMAHVQLGSFMVETACTDVAKAINDAQFATGNTANVAKSLILDLRGNGGGRVDIAQCIFGLFKGNALLTTFKYIIPGVPEVPQNGTGFSITDLPMVVLVDAGSASASEMLSGALQDHKRAWIVGEPSFGKGSMQAATNRPELNPFPTLVESLIFHQTMALFYRPGGKTVELTGVTPDVEAYFKPNPTEDEKFAPREKNYSRHAIRPANEDDMKWVNLRPRETAQINACVAKNHRALDLYNKSTTRDELDYQLLVAQETLLCAGVK